MSYQDPSWFVKLGYYFLSRINAIIWSGFPIFFWARVGWSEDEIPDQSGKVVLITGGNSGTGYATAKAMYDHGAKVYIACRDEKRAQAAIKDIQAGGELGIGGMIYPKEKQNVNAKGSKGEVIFIQCDLADLDSVESCAEEFKKETRLDILFANAGIMATEPGQYTKQGYTLQFGTNVIGHHLLITLLLPLLLSTSQSTHTRSRLITVSSAGHMAAPSGGIDYTSIRRGGKQLDRWTEYGQSKWGDIALAKWVDWHFKDHVISVSLHPGMISSNLWHHLPFAKFLLTHGHWFLRIINVLPKDGAVNQLWAATIPEAQAQELSGEYLVPYRRVGMARMDVNDRRKVERMWEWCVEEEGKRK